MKSYFWLLIPVILLLGLISLIAQDVARAGTPESGAALQPQTAISEAFTYQGFLNKGTQTVNGTCDLSIEVWDSLIGGNPLGSNSINNVPVVNGLFTVKLSFGSIFSADQARWLATGVHCSGDANYTWLSPRIEITAAPYASYALNNWGLMGNSHTNFASFLGTLDNVPLIIGANGQVGLRIESATKNPNIIGGYSGNTITSTINGGTIAGGGADLYENTVGQDFGSIGGGLNNHVNGLYGVVAGGASNQISGDYSGVGGGYFNTVSGVYGTLAGGNSNTASGVSSMVPGGSNNLAQGDTSFAAGNRAKSLHNGCFTWADSNPFDFTCSLNNAFTARATGGVYFVSGINGAGAPTAGVWLSAGGSGWGVLSDRSSKTNLAAVNGGQLLEKLAQMPIETWSYKTQDASIRHIGPMAQDFAAAFGVGEDNKHINTVDADGVSLAAIQALYRLSQDKDAQIARLEQQIETLQRRLDGIDPAGSTKVGLTFDLSTIFSLAALAGVALLWLRGQKKQEG